VFPVADDQLQHVLAAYALLRDAEGRSNYDRTTRRTPASGHLSEAPAPATIAGVSVPVKISVTHLGEHAPASADQRRPPIWAGPVLQRRGSSYG
jgi:hypothetical protein